jgi:dynein heavy chain, axonemal
MEELYGNFDPLTQTWTDGLASKLLRQYVQTPEHDKRQWVVFDGPVDALWVENMNSVLDDSMVLCLSNGERIKLHPKMKILFEVPYLCLGRRSLASLTRHRLAMRYGLYRRFCPHILRTHIFILRVDQSPRASAASIAQ